MHVCRRIACCTVAEPHQIGLFDFRTSTASATLDLSRERTGKQARSLGTCMALCRAPSVGPHALLSVFESTDVCLWDIRRPTTPMSPPLLAGNPASPALCAAVLWKQVWVASANGDIDVVKFRRDGRLQEATQPRKVNATMVPYEVGDDSGTAWQSEKRGVNALAVRHDLRLVAAARWDRRVELLDSKTRCSLGRLRCHDRGVLCTAFDRERGLLATSGEDGRIALWDVLSQTYDGPVLTSGGGAAEHADC